MKNVNELALIAIDLLSDKTIERIALESGFAEKVNKISEAEKEEPKIYDHNCSYCPKTMPCKGRECSHTFLMQQEKELPPEERTPSWAWGGCV